MSATVPLTPIGTELDPLPARHVVFSASGEWFALPLSSVREVAIPQPPFARVPRTSDAVRGVMNLRGRVVVVVDLAALMGLPAQPLRGGQGQVLILDRDKRALGLLIGNIRGVETFVTPAEGEDPVVRGVVQVCGNAATVLDPVGVAGASAALFSGH